MQLPLKRYHSGCCWMTYGYLKNDQTVLVVTACQVLLYSIYCVFYWFMSRDKLWITIKVGIVVAMCTTLILSVKFFGMKVFHPLGIVCMTLNIADFAAPLAGLTPNGIGSLLAFGQLFLFVILPRKPGQRSLLSRLFGCYGPSEKETDLEAPRKEIIPQVEENDDDENATHLTRAHRWSKKVIANVNSVAEEIEHVIGKASIHHSDH
ncbi:hypothetical protein TELCIR_17009, partial [Teladorsagia circumcincta]